ncbi:chorismate-binding protein [Aquimarina sp. 2201CG14-23]|uniref:chorismate-binding protein n=1 Tax=Aquimarina mycalae TaxID=3040073 RepID=UPI0024782B41|nr:chorismate-binding protein [Aquimarina sp. 2201CG14-23]MDH7445764.1 chorismate-binding protein [Aquimarina sp. 2201CG14-23]
MDVEDIYIKIQSQLDHQLPFVVYRKSGEQKLHALLQHDDDMYLLETTSDSGFVFAPFDSIKKSILIPTENSDCYDITIPNNNKMSIDVKKKKQSINTSIAAKKAHIELVDKGVKAIQDDFFKKVVLSRKEEIQYSSDSPLMVFKRLIRSYPNAFVYYWYHPLVGTWLGATPETLVKIRGNQFFTMALAGTQPYVDTVHVDWGLKEIEEQSMVTDFVLQELSTKVNDIKKSETYTYKAGTLLHLRTDIKGTLNEKTSIGEVIKALHPTPAVCGLPKNEAKSFIVEKEQYDRKFYTGFLGELNFNQNGTTASNLFVNLRCMELKADKAIVYVGGGVTKDSIPEKEWEETVKKTETMKKVLQ